MILKRCPAKPEHGFWSAAYPQMARLPDHPDAILALARSQAEGWHDQVIELGQPGILTGRGELGRCRICAAGLVPVPPVILAEAERQHDQLFSTN